MLRRTLCALSLEQLFVDKQATWNIDFGGSPLTKKIVLHHHADGSQPKAIPMFHIMDNEGNVVNPEYEPKLTQEEARKMYFTMVKQRSIDKVLLDSQRQGRISFFMTALGEEAAVAGVAGGLASDDFVFHQYRELGLLTFRGYTIKQIVSQCMGNIEDVLKGRQMPMHYGDTALHVQCVSSPLGTQISHAAGAGYSFKLEGKKRICVCWFGEGAASEGDFHAGLNFAATRGAITLFVCRNNGFAISTPTMDQYHGDGICPRAIAYGMPCIRVDGQDALAVYVATQKARETILEHTTPMMIETMAYRCGDHSTSDDSTLYRKKETIKEFEETFNPIRRFGKYLIKKQWIDEKETDAVTKETRGEVLKELVRQEKLPLQPPEEMFTDTYKVPIPTLEIQRDETLAHYERNKAYYQKGH